MTYLSAKMRPSFSASGYLKPEEYMPHAPSERGEQVHVNHAGCPAGEDRKGRLYVKRTETDDVVAYCHHCGGRGFSGASRAFVGYRQSGDALSSVRWRKRSAPSTVPRIDGTGGAVGRKLPTLPRDATPHVGDWPPHAKLWPESFGVQADALGRKGWCYSPKYDRLLIPVFDREHGGLLGYQARRLSDRDTDSRKYLTVKEKGKRLYYHATAPITAALKNKAVVLVEDALSAEKVSAFADAVAVLTVTADSTLRDKLLDTGYDTVVVWLDDDNTDVKRKQLALKTMFDPYVRVVIVRTSKDPKRHAYQEIKEVLTNAVG